MGTFFDYLFPPKCCACECIGSYLCEYCRIDLVESFLMDDGLLLRHPYDAKRKFFAITACKPTRVLRQIIHTFKYTHTEELTDVLGRMLALRLAQFKLSQNIWIVPIPLHSSRVRERGFNQSFLLAQHVAAKLGLRVADILERTRSTFPQAQLSKSDRVKNVRDAFSLKKNVRVLPETILLLDDVITTGSTFAECREVLVQAGVKNVFGLALAHGL